MNVSTNPRRRALAIAIASSLLVFSAAAIAAPEPDANAEPEAVADAGSPDRLQGIEVSSAAPNEAELYLDEKRTSSVVIEGLGAQQIARTGDSNVATTLKRIPGLSLIGGKYVYVRGLGERYSSVLLNGASVPSPDYTRRVVPLDLFPNDVLSGVIVQKSYSPDMPGEFGGGTVQLRTRDVPTKFFFKLSGGLGYIDGTTGEDGDRYAGGARDWTGYDDGSRELPASLAAATANGAFLRPRTSLNPSGATPQQLQDLGRDLAGVGYGVYDKKLGPDTGYAASIGNGWKFGDDVRFGVVAAVRYSQSWQKELEQRNTYAASNVGLDRIGNLDVDITERSIDASGFINLGLDIGNQHKIGLTSLLLRQSNDHVKISDGTVDNVDSRYTELKWTENQLRTNQLFGHHVFPTANYLELDWQYSKASAGRDEPNTRQYRYDYLTPTIREYSSRSDGNAQTFGLLSDDQTDHGFKAMLPFDWGDASRLALSAGTGRLSRDRDSSFRRYTFLLTPGTPLLVTPGFLQHPIDRILAPGNIRPDGFILRETTRATDNYSAEQTLKSGFFNADLDLEGKFRFALGARRESNDQEVTTFSIVNATAPPIIATDRGSIWLPAASTTWRYSD
ncbi:MAG: TonB-dependent receptor plug domain-containing protein, partial [Dokdonella sp.]